MAGNKTTPKSPVDTGNKTISGRTIWNDPETGKDYSERSTTFEIDGKYYTMPTVAKNGGQYTSDTIRDYVKENGPIDYITGEKLPEFRNREDAIEYAISRSSTRKKPKAGMSEGGSVEDQTEEGFGLDALVGLDKPVNLVGGLSKKNAPKPVNAPVGRQSMLLTAEDRSTLADLTPIVGDLKGAYETVDMIAVELAKEEPNYYAIGAMGGIGVAAAIVGLFPGLGDAGAKAMREGAKSLGDVAKRIEVDTSSMGSGLGNVRLKPKKIDETLNTSFSNPLEIGVSQASENGALLKSYTIDDVKSLDELSLSANAGTKKANSLLNAPVEDGTKVGIRLNLNSNIPNAPAGRNKLQTLHNKNFNGSPLSYRSHATVENVTFNVSQKGRTGIAARINKLDVPEAQNKFPAMSVDGNLTNSRNVLEEMGDDVVEIGFNPRNLHLFVDMNTGQAVKGAEVATVVGDRVYAKGVTYMKKTDAPKPLPASDGTELPSEVRYKFREGGAVPMNNQMRQFAIGGLSDDGMDRDPVSGNEIPPGSLAEEVRDDVPAQLSEGEYVVPADVVRFFGVRVFEEMRMEAKMGLQQMEQNGRIGGEPATATAPPPSDDLSPAEEQLLQEIMAMEQAPQQQGMAEGGVVNAAYGISVGEGDGLTEDITISTGGPAGGGGSDSGMREVFFIHPDGRRIKVLLLNDTPIGKVPEDFDTFVTDTPENRVEIDFKDTTGETGSGVGTASGVDSRGGSGDAVPGATGRNSVAVGETYTKPNGESATRMPDEYYMAGGQSDENRRNQEFFDSIGEEAPEKTIEDTGINYEDPTAGATDALSAGKNELMQLGAGLFPLLGVINSGVQAKAISKANANAIIALRKGDTEAHAAIIKQIETYQNVHSTVLADAGTWFAGLFVDAGQNRVDDFEEITGKTSVDGLYPTTGEGYDEGFKRVDVAPTSSPLNEEQKEKRLEALKEEYEKNKAKEEASKSREQRKAEKERKAAEAERVKQQKIVREKRQREVSEANRIKEGVKLAADAAASQAAAYQAAQAAARNRNNDNDRGGGSGLGSANNSGLGYAPVTGFGKADGPGGQGFVNRAYAAEGGLVSRPKKKKK